MNIICIDLKSFYASVECVDRGLDPLDTNLTVADESRTDKTICLAASPTLKGYCGVGGRARLFEVRSAQKNVNANRLRKLREIRHDKNVQFEGKSYLKSELDAHPEYEMDIIVAPPQMKRYMKFSNEIVEIYMRYVAPEDVHVYSVDEVFMDVTAYLKNYHMTAKELAVKIVREVYTETGITATAGIGPNLFIAKVAMDVVAKKMPPDENGARVCELDEMSYREQIWAHEPITDVWRVGPGYRKRLAPYGIKTMGDVARCSIENEELLYRLFGVNAEILIDHAWGYEPTEIKYIHQYQPENNSVGSGQVLTKPYTYEKGELIVREMTELLVLDLVKKRLVTDQVILNIGYDKESLDNPLIREKHKGEVKKDRYGRLVPKSAHGSSNLDHYMSSSKQIVETMVDLYRQITDENLLIRRVNVTANHVIFEGDIPEEKHEARQLTLFDNIEEEEKEKERMLEAEKKERRLQHAILDIQKRYGKNALLKGMNLEDDAMTIERNGQVGGHKG
ncbi:MAG: DNA methylase [Eubacterium sp.]|nr:DNA methylase [Eubacterium sp.]